MKYGTDINGTQKTMIDRDSSKVVNILDLLAEMDVHIQTNLDNYFIYGGETFTLLKNGGTAEVYLHAINDCTIYPGEVTAKSVVAGEVNMSINRFFGATITPETGNLVSIYNPNDLSENIINGADLEIRFNPTFVTNGTEIKPLETNIVAETEKHTEAERGKRYILKAGQTMRALITNNDIVKDINVLVVSGFSLK